MTEGQRRFLFAAFGTLLLCAGLAFVAGCNVLRPAVAPHAQVAAICQQLDNRNAAITCVKAGYSVIRDTARVADQRYRAGALPKDQAQWIKQRLDEAYFATEVADMAVSAGDFGEARARMQAVIGLLTAIEEKLK